MTDQTFTPQETFDLISVGLLRQGKRSGVVAPNAYKGFRCLYRSPDGCRCAAGLVLDDQDYSPELENMIVEAIQESRLAVGSWTRHSPWLLVQLQEMHDDLDTPVDDWPQALRGVAARHNLSTEKMDQFLCGT